MLMLFSGEFPLYIFSKVGVSESSSIVKTDAKNLFKTLHTSESSMVSALPFLRGPTELLDFVFLEMYE